MLLNHLGPAVENSLSTQDKQTTEVEDWGMERKLFVP